MPRSRIKPKKLEKILYYPKKNYRTAVRILRLLSEYEFLTTNSISERLGKRWENPHSRTKTQMQYLNELGYCSEFGMVSNLKHVCDHCNKSTAYLVRLDSIKSSLRTLEDNKKQREEFKKLNPEKFNPSNWFDCEEGNVLGRLIWLTCSNCYKSIEPHKEEQYKIRDYHYWCLSNNGLYVMLVLLKKDTLYNFVEKFKTDRILELVNVLLKSQKKEDVDRLVTYVKQAMKIKPIISEIVITWFNEVIGSIRQKEIDSSKYPLLADYQNEHRFEWMQQDLMNNRRFR